MPTTNPNPISLDQMPQKSNYVIDPIYNETMIYLTIKVELLSTGWQYAAAHSIILDGDDIYPLLSPEPRDLKLNYANKLKGLRLFIGSHISRVRRDAEDSIPPIVRYHLIIEAGDELLDEYILDSNTNNPSDFNSLILFR